MEHLWLNSYIVISVNEVILYGSLPNKKLKRLNKRVGYSHLHALLPEFGVLKTPLLFDLPLVERSSRNSSVTERWRHWCAWANMNKYVWSEAGRVHMKVVLWQPIADKQPVVSWPSVFFYPLTWGSVHCSQATRVTYRRG